MSREEDFERERRAFHAVLDAVQDLMLKGYEVRMYDNAPISEMEALFVGPAVDGQRSDVRKLRIPFEYLSLILANDPQAAHTYNVLMTQIAALQRQLYALLQDALLKNLEDIGHGRDSSGGKKEYQA